MNIESFLRGNQKNLAYLSENKAWEKIWFLSLHLSGQPTPGEIKGAIDTKNMLAQVQKATAFSMT